jgi:23S rRNA pseudouridine2605 synthase
MPHAYSHALREHSGSHQHNRNNHHNHANHRYAYGFHKDSQQNRHYVPGNESRFEHVRNVIDPGSHGTNPSEAVEGVRLQKVLAQAGYGSRRKCEQMITDGRVEVDDALVTQLGYRVFPQKQTIKVDGSRVHINDRHVTLAVNKPTKVLSTMDDPQGRWTLRDIIGDGYRRIFHMGRLDYDSEGLILMTDDGELAEHVMHPRYEIEKTYVASVSGDISTSTVRRMVSEGVHLKDGWIHFDHAVILGGNREHATVKVVLHSGKNRIVRRMFDAVGYPVYRLIRTKIGPISVEGIHPGSYRILKLSEVKQLEEEVGL